MDFIEAYTLLGGSRRYVRSGAIITIWWDGDDPRGLWRAQLVDGRTVLVHVKDILPLIGGPFTDMDGREPAGRDYGLPGMLTD